MNNPSDIKLRECREAFEAWFSKQTATDGMSEIYPCSHQQAAWEAYQEATRHTDHLLELAVEALREIVTGKDKDGMKTDFPRETALETLLTLQQHGYGKD